MFSFHFAGAEDTSGASLKVFVLSTENWTAELVHRHEVFEYTLRAEVQLSSLRSCTLCAGLEIQHYIFAAWILLCSEL